MRLKIHTHCVVVEHDDCRFVFSVINCASSDRLCSGDEEHVLAGSYNIKRIYLGKKYEGGGGENVT